MEDLVYPTLAFVSAHQSWAFALMFAGAFGESFVFLSLLVPGTALLVAAGVLAATGALPPVPVLAGAVLGAVLGDALSYWIGRRFGRALEGVWPFTRDPDLLARGVRFFGKWGGISVFVGRFFGPLRAVVPLAAGIMQMPADRFWAANVASAVVWAPMLLYLGHRLGKLAEELIGTEYLVMLVLAGVLLFGLAGVAWAVMRTGRSRS